MNTKPVFRFPIQTPIFNDRVKLVPFDAGKPQQVPSERSTILWQLTTLPDLHSHTFISQTRSHPDLFAHMPDEYFETIDKFKSLITEPGSILSNSNPTIFLFAIIDTTKGHSPEDEEGELAGTIAYINTSEANLSAEIGAVVILPKYQQTHVTTNAVGLLMLTAYASPEKGGLGLVRTEWKCNATNIASRKVAERMGYQKVGMIPYQMKFPLGKKTGKIGNGNALPPGSDPDDLWRDTTLYSLSWDIWENEARGKVVKAMGR